MLINRQLGRPSTVLTTEFDENTTASGAGVTEHASVDGYISVLRIDVKTGRGRLRITRPNLYPVVVEIDFMAMDTAKGILPRESDSKHKTS
jgi:hypothetical protein